MASFINKNKSSASTCTTEGSTTSSSPASSVNLVTTNSHISQQQQQHNNSVTTNNNNNAPKYGTLVPNRIFVGGISVTTTETELAQLFSAYGNVKATKVINDRAGVSKGYGFVTFETEEEAKRLMHDSECIVLKERKLNIAPAIKKQPFSRTYEAASPPAVHSNTVFYQNGVPYTFHNGVAYFPATPPQHATTGDPTGVYQPTYGPPPAAPTHSPAATAYPVIYPCTAPPTMYVAPQQFQYQPLPPPAPTSQYIYTSTSSTTTAAAPGTGPPVTQGSPMLGAPAPLPPTQHYYTPAHLNPPDLYYSVPQPYPTMISNDGIVYETPPQTETSSNQSAEDSCSNSSNSDTVRSGGGGTYKLQQSQEKSAPKYENKVSSTGSNWTAPNATTMSQPPSQQRQNTSTPVVSLLKIQQMSEEYDINHAKKGCSPDFMNASSYYQQVPPPPPKSQTPMVPILYQSMPSMFLTHGHYPPPPAAMMNGHTEQQGGQYQNQRSPYTSKPYMNRRGGGAGGPSGNQSSMTFHIPPFPPKFHFFNNNHVPISSGCQKRHFNNRNQNHFRGRDGGRYMGPNPNRPHRRFFPVNSNNAFPGNITKSPIPSVTTKDGTVEYTSTTATNTISSSTPTITTTNSTSPPPAPYSPMTHPVIVPSDSSCVSPPQQVQFYPSGNNMCRQGYYPPSNGTNQQQLAQPRRFVNSSRKGGNSNGSTSSNNGNSRGNGGSNGKFCKNMNGVQVLSSGGNSGASKMMGSIDEVSLGGAGDASSMCQNQGSVMQETCHQMQALSL